MMRIVAKSVSQKTYGFAGLQRRKGRIIASFTHPERNMAIRPKGRQFAWIAALRPVCRSAAQRLPTKLVRAEHGFERVFKDAHALIDLFVGDDERDKNT